MNANQADILVIGATGQTGSELVRQLASDQVATRALVRDPGKSQWLADLDVSVFEGDLSQRDSIERAVGGVTGIYLAMPGLPDQMAWCQNVIDAARANGGTPIVKCSALRASPTAGGPGPRVHGETDELLTTSSLPVAILRPNSFMQNVLQLAPLIRQNGQFQSAAGAAQISMVDVGDIAASAKVILTTGEYLGGTFYLTGPHAISFHDVAKVLSEVIGRTVEYVPVSVEDAVSSMVDVGVPVAEARVRAATQGQFSTTANGLVTDDVSHLLGRPPRSFEQFAADNVQAFK